MNVYHISKALPAIKQGIFSIDEFALAAGLGKGIASELLKFLAKNEVGSIDSTYVEFHLSDKMRAAALAIRLGADPEDVSQMLGWKDFEVLAASALDANGYTTIHGFRLKRPRIEIDVVGIKDSMGLLVDCKHWKRSSQSALDKFASMQIERTKVFLETRKNLKYAIPVIVTLHPEATMLAQNVPVVPIVKFRAFLNEMFGYLDEIKLLRHN